jgi:hypothetical protein
VCDDFVNLESCQLGLGLSEILIGIGCVCGGGVIGPVLGGCSCPPRPPSLAVASFSLSFMVQLPVFVSLDQMSHAE